MASFGGAFGGAFSTLIKSLGAKDPNLAVGNMTNFYRHADNADWIEDKNINISYGRFDVLRSARWHKVKTEYVGDVEIIGQSYLIVPEGFE